MNILYITANPKNIQDSTSLTIGKAFVDAYQAAHPGDTLTTLDLYQADIGHLTLTDLNEMGSPAGLIQRSAAEFAKYDKYVIASPMWNLNIPSILKAYVDHIMAAGILFKYGAHGIPRGLMQGKKACVILSRGGAYGFWPLSAWAYDKRYLNRFFRFIGITDIAFIEADGTELHRDRVPQIREKGIQKAQKIAATF